MSRILFYMFCSLAIMAFGANGFAARNEPGVKDTSAASAAKAPTEAPNGDAAAPLTQEKIKLITSPTMEAKSNDEGCTDCKKRQAELENKCAVKGSNCIPTGKKADTPSNVPTRAIQENKKGG